MKYIRARVFSFLMPVGRLLESAGMTPDARSRVANFGSPVSKQPSKSEIEYSNSKRADKPPRETTPLDLGTPRTPLNRQSDRVEYPVERWRSYTEKRKRYIMRKLIPRNILVLSRLALRQFKLRKFMSYKFRLQELLSHRRANLFTYL
ncbi:hypothetical protein PUN28_009425 [Cardiocondyla obscurior]|uniref:Uncharacterized protein n=1 Tax=Cardiocondyla obscurior TaxID=286306 RepID=A0AAW2FTP9_9HYME